MDPADLANAFREFRPLVELCRFADCRHRAEPGCAVQAAVETGELDADRFESYNKLKKELAYLDLRKDEAAIMKARKRDKEMGKLYKSVQKNNPKRF